MYGVLLLDLLLIANPRKTRISHILKTSPTDLHEHALYTCIGRHPCLWCTIRGDEMKVPRDQRSTPSQRSLNSLEADYLQFQANGKGDIRKVKDYNNVMERPFFNIPITQVSNSQYKLDIHVHVRACSSNYLHMHTYIHWCTCTYTVGVSTWITHNTWHIFPLVVPLGRRLSPARR